MGSLFICTDVVFVKVAPLDGRKDGGRPGGAKVGMGIESRVVELSVVENMSSRSANAEDDWWPAATRGGT